MAVSHLLVDTGAEFAWINAKTLKNIGVKREKKDYTFVMANGQQITRAVGLRHHSRRRRAHHR